MRKVALATAIALLIPFQALAFDGWREKNATVIEGKPSGWDYVSLDEATGRLFIGHRKEGLQVFDTAARKLIKVVDKTASESPNGATLMPEFDLAIANNENGTITPFKLSTLEARDPIKLGEELDTSHYDPATKRILVNMASGKDGTELVVLDAPALTVAGKIKIAAKKPEHAASDGKGMIYLAARDQEAIIKIDLKAMAIVGEYPTPGCGQTNGVAIDTATNRLFIGCRGNAQAKPAFAVMDLGTNKIIFTAEIGAGNDDVIYDAELKRIFLANGVGANLNIFEQVDADSYKPVETLGTRSGVRTMAMDHKTKTIFAVYAEGSADAGKKINTAVGPFYANTFFPNSFTVLTYSK
jgi:hypothetical protein